MSKNSQKEWKRISKLDRYFDSFHERENDTASESNQKQEVHPLQDILPRRSVPEWLLAIVENGEMPVVFPLEDILLDSCYYPASGLDASPVVILAGFVHSFIYVDYWVKREYYEKEIYFEGYTKILHRAVEAHEVVPKGWKPIMPRYFDKYNGHEQLMNEQSRCEPFGDWTIWERNEESSEEIGPKYFSLFFLAAEGVATYQGLYLYNHIVPKVIAIIQPGHAMGGNWTCFTNGDAPFWQFVEKGGTPDFLLIGEYGVSSHVWSSIHGYQELSTVITTAPDETRYIYDESEHKTDNLQLALELAEKTGFKVQTITKEGLKHTVCIYRKRDNVKSSSRFRSYRS